VNLLDKIQKLPEKKRKIILWGVMTILIIFSFWIYLRDIQKRLKVLKREEIEKEFPISELKEKLKMPKLEIPKF